MKKTESKEAIPKRLKDQVQRHCPVSMLIDSFEPGALGSEDGGSKITMQPQVSCRVREPRFVGIRLGANRELPANQNKGQSSY